MVRDEDGLPIKDGDHITFTFGIPPISVLARVQRKQGGDLWIECLSPPDVEPKHERLSDLMRWYQVWKAAPKKDKAHLARVATLKCCICEAFGGPQISRTYVHHCIHDRYSQAKASDRETIPLCYDHHYGKRGIHTDKSAWRQEYGADHEYIAATLDKLGV